MTRDALKQLKHVLTELHTMMARPLWEVRKQLFDKHVPHEARDERFDFDASIINRATTVATVIALRALDDFFQGQVQKDDLDIRDFGCEPVGALFDSDERMLINKRTAHITKARSDPFEKVDITDWILRACEKGLTFLLTILPQAKALDAPAAESLRMEIRRIKWYQTRARLASDHVKAEQAGKR